VDLQTPERRELAALGNPANVKRKVFRIFCRSAELGFISLWKALARKVGIAGRADMAQQMREQRIGAEFFGQGKGINGVPGRPWALEWSGALWQLLKDVGLNHIGG
jgi:hypothetical protein